MKSHWLIWLLVSCSGCSLLPPASSTSETAQARWQTHQADLKKLETWYFTGRIAITTEQESWTAHVHWQQQKKNYRLRLHAPLGQSSVLLDGNAHHVIMRTSDQKTAIADTPEQLIAQKLKLDIPVTGLYFWIRGLPAPEPMQHQINAAGYLYTLEQADWHIDYERYTIVEGITLPTRIFLKNDRFKVKIVISHWYLQNLPVPTI